MAEETKVSQAISELRNADEEKLRAVIEHWFEQTRTDGMNLGASMIAAAVNSIINMHTGKAAKTTLRDYERMTKEIRKLIAVQLYDEDENEEVTEQNNYKEGGETS